MKKLLVLLSAVACVSMAQASELWWFVADTVTVDGVADVQWDTARLFANSSGSDNNGGTQIGSAVTHADMQDMLQAYGDLGNESYTSFYVELYNSTGEKVGISYSGARWNATSASDIEAAGGIYDGVLNPSATPYQFDTFAIPEPTSGLLVMLGMMMLGLKRKRV